MADDHPPNPAPRLVEDGASLEDLAAAVQECTSCDLYARATQAVFGEGQAGARFLLVGEQPGDSEDRQGSPFVGPAGTMLDRALDESGIDRSDTYVTNVVKHFKWKGAGGDSKPRLHAKPNRSEVSACLPWLDAELDRVAPEVVVCLGATAAQALLGPDIRVTRDHGVPIDMDGRSVVATIHPSAVLRGGERRSKLFAQLVDDLTVASRLAGGS